MNVSNTSRHGRRWVHLILALTAVCPIHAQNKLRRSLKINDVPVGQQATIVEDSILTVLPDRTLANSAVGGRVTAGAPSWSRFVMESSIENLASSGGSNGAGCGLFVDDMLTIGGTNAGANASVEYEWEIEGVFEVRGGLIPASGNPKFNPFCSLRVRFESSRSTVIRTLEVDLASLLSAAGGVRPRTETKTYPFKARSVVTHQIVVGEPFKAEFDFTADCTFTFATFAGSAPVSGQFSPVQELQGLGTRASGRVSGVRILGNSVINPTITGGSGTDYTPLLRRPERSEITLFSFDPSSRRVILEWQTPNDSTASFTIRRSSDLELPSNQWTLVTGSAVRTGITSRSETILPAPAPTRQFFSIQPN